VENRPGAGGAIAADWVLRQKGTQTLLFMSSTSVAQNISSEWTSCPSEFWRPSHTLLSQKEIPPASLAEYMNGASREEKYRNGSHRRRRESHSPPHRHKAFQRLRTCRWCIVPYQGSAPAILSVAGGHGSACDRSFSGLPPVPGLASHPCTNRQRDWDGRMGRQSSRRPETSPEEVARLSRFSGKHPSGPEKLRNVGFEQVWRSGSEVLAMHEKDLRTVAAHT
jgi:hypothetical protein